MISEQIIEDVWSLYGIKVNSIGKVFDNSRTPSDKRYIYPVNDAYMLKFYNNGSISEAYLNDVDRLIKRYKEIGIYCPSLVKNKRNQFAVFCKQDDDTFSCYVEEMARFRLMDPGRIDSFAFRKELVKHLGVLASAYTNIDLSVTKSMWSIIDLAPLDKDVDEKQEHLNRLVRCLKSHQLDAAADLSVSCNEKARMKIKEYFSELPRCVYQGDLNFTNILVDDTDCFAGLIDFNMFGTEVNINCFLNETFCEPEPEEYNKYSANELFIQMQRQQDELLNGIWENYSLSEAEKICFPEYRKIIGLSQYPIVQSWIKMLEAGIHTEKICDLLHLIANQN